MAALPYPIPSRFVGQYAANVAALRGETAPAKGPVTDAERRSRSRARIAVMAEGKQP